MRQIWLLFALLFVSEAAYGQAVVSGHVKLPDATAPANAKICVTLQNFKPNVPRVIGTGEIVSTTNYCQTPAADGSYSFNLYQNSTITPFTTNWRVDFLLNGIQVFSATYLVNHSPFNLDTETPLSASTPAGPNQLILNVFPFTQLTPSTTWTIPHNFNDSNTIALLAGLNGNDIYPDSKNCRTEPNNCTVTFVTPTAGFAIAMHAAQISISSSQPNAIVSNPIGAQVISAQSLTVSGPLTASANGLGGNVALKNASADIVVYVSTTGSDLNDGLSWGSAKLTVSGAQAILPTCTANDIKGTSRTFPCGKIYVGAGVFSLTSGIIVTSPGVSIIGQGSDVTQFTWTGAGCALTVNQFSGAASGAGNLVGGIFEGFSIDGSGNANTSACGFKYLDLSAILIRDVKVANFTAAGDSCLWGDSGSHWNERVEVHAWLGNCKTGWLTTNSRSALVTLGYGIFDLYINITAGQTGVASVGNGISAPIAVQHSNFHIVVNFDGSGSTSQTCVSLTNYALWSYNSGSWRCDGSGNAAGTAWAIDGTSHFTMTGPATSDQANNITAGGKFWVLRVGQPGSTFPIDLLTQGNSYGFFEAPSSCSTGCALNFPPTSGTISASASMLYSNATPTIISGFNTGSVSGANGPASFVVTVGSSGASSVGVVGLQPNASSFWTCHADNQTRAALISMTTATNNSVTLTNYGSTFAATNWTNGDIINIWCSAR